MKEKKLILRKQTKHNCPASNNWLITFSSLDNPLQLLFLQNYLNDIHPFVKRFLLFLLRRAEMLQRNHDNKVLLISTSSLILPFGVNDIDNKMRTESVSHWKARVIPLPDSSRWRFYCQNAMLFRFLARPRLTAFFEILKEIPEPKIAFVVHKARVLRPVCAVARAIVDEDLCDWSKLRIILTGEHISDLEIARACRKHGTSLGVIADSRLDKATSPFKEIIRLYNSI